MNLMPQQQTHPQINMSKLAVGSDVGGILFALGCILIALIGIPTIRYLFPFAVLLGLAIAVVLHFIQPKPTGKDWLTPAIENSPSPAAGSHKPAKFS
jgi:hypothetical protein